MKIIQTITISNLNESMRLSSFCERHIDYFESKKSVKKAVSNGSVLLNNLPKKGGAWLQVGDIITVIDLENTPPKTYELEIPVIYEDEHLAVVNKPPGLTVSGNQFKTLYNALSYNLEESSLPNALRWPLPVHRLDNQTSGLVIIAKTKTSRIALGDLFEKKLIHKAYRAIASGKFTDVKEGTFEGLIDSKNAITKYKIISESRSLKNDWLTLVELYPLTGRTHQLRKHLSQNGTPILGDKLYANETIKHKGLFLCACQLNFTHPSSGEMMNISIPMPSKFQKRLNSEQSRWEQYHTP